MPCSSGTYQHKYGKHESINLGRVGRRQRLIFDELDKLDELAELDEVGHSEWDG